MVFGLVGDLVGGLFSDSESQEFSRESETETEAESQDLSPELLAALEELFLGTVDSGQFQEAGEAVSSRLGQLRERAEQPRFDAESFSEDVTGQAAASAGLDMESSINEILSQSGVSEGGNSMSALLGNRLRNQTAANLAGVQADARATGEDIRLRQDAQLTEGISGLSGSLAEQILGLVQQTRGAKRKGTSRSTEETSGTGSGESTPSPFSAISDVFGMFSDARSSA